MISQRQQEIIEASLELITKKGIQGLTIKNLSKKIRVTEPAIYRHFESKIHILTEILNLFKENCSKIFETESKSKVSSIEKIEHLFQNHFATFMNMPSLTAIIFSEDIFRNNKMLSQKVSEVIDYNHKILNSIIEEGQQKKEIRNDIEPKNLTIMIMGTLRLFVKKWQFSEFAFNLNNEGKNVISMIKLLICNK